MLPALSPDLSESAAHALEKLGVTVLTGAKVLDLAADHVLIERAGANKHIDAGAVMWALRLRA